jgi:hypothetical protein
MTTPQCSNCLYGQTVSGAVRLCRRRGPQPSSPTNTFPQAKWPGVADTDWCGDGADKATGNAYSSKRRAA